MGYDRGPVPILADDSTGSSSTYLEPNLHIMNHTSHPTRAIPNLCPLIRDKGDSLVEGCVANLPEQITVNVRQNNLEDLVRIWNQWDLDTKGIFAERYGDIAHLITIRVDEQLIQAMVRFWEPAYQCFTFNQKDMAPTIEEYAALLRIDNVQFGKIYVKEPKPMTFKKKLVRLTDMTDAWAEKQIRKKNETICIPWSSLRDLVKTRSQPCPDYLSRDIQVPEYLSKGWKGTIYRMCTVAQCLDFESFLESRAHSIPYVFKNIRPARSLPQERMAEGSHRATLGISFSESSRRGYNVESTLDPSFSSAIQMRKPRLGTFTRVMGRSWICSAISPKAVFFTTIPSRNWRISTVRVRFRE
ncbi:hypothetical protein CXB51_010330 [Gossypium anomalum]|uniref:DUF7745 domain-containing protein n=1 Tax=Gossypium anomalum TaxID=47600 RepID=A0A8J5YMG5_9ROSI|nr:hypothetical protein CXB51_010330 [Gossypium anomalum]